MNVTDSAMFISGNALNLLLNLDNMKTLRANQKLEQIIANVEKKGLEAPQLIEDLKELREMALLEANMQNIAQSGQQVLHRLTHIERQK